MGEAPADRGGGWVLAQSALMVALLASGPLGSGQWPGAALLSAGGLFFLAGAAIGLAGVLTLGRDLTAFPKPRAGAVLVQRGIYARVRHPLYTSVLLLALGWSLLWCSPPALAIAALLALLLDRKARREEVWLRERFPEYAGYAKRVRRFVPFLY